METYDECVLFIEVQEVHLRALVQQIRREVGGEEERITWEVSMIHTLRTVTW